MNSGGKLLWMRSMLRIFYLSRGLEMMHPRTGIEQRPRLFKRQQYVTLGNERKFDPARLREG